MEQNTNDCFVLSRTYIYGMLVFINILPLAGQYVNEKKFQRLTKKAGNRAGSFLYMGKVIYFTSSKSTSVTSACLPAPLPCCCCAWGSPWG